MQCCVLAWDQVPLHIHSLPFYSVMNKTQKIDIQSRFAPVWTSSVTMSISVPIEFEDFLLSGKQTKRETASKSGGGLGPRVT